MGKPGLARHTSLALQASTTIGIASFDDQATMGKVGEASMRPAAERNAVKELLVGNEDLKQAAEVILGRLDIADLIGGSNVQYKAAEVYHTAQSTCDMNLSHLQSLTSA